MIINQSNLSILYTAFTTSFNQGLGMAEPMQERIATRVPSGTRESKYGWLGKVPGFREWLGDRVIQNAQAHDYSIVNKSYENTLGVERDDIEDDQFGIYAPLFTAMGEATAAHPSELVFALLASGFATACYDGQFFFDTDHPVLDVNGVEQSVVNTDGGAGTAWYLLDTRRALKPLIWQVRKDYNFVAMTQETDANVFTRKEYLYGVDARSNVGFGFWQMAWGSKQTLSKTTYALGRQSLMGMKGDYDRPLGIMPNLLLVPPSLETEGLEILNSERDAAGATNVYKGTAELLVCPWLA